MDFIGIDFETANSSRTSPCSLGIAIVKNNQVVDSKHWLIKPEPLEFNDFNVAIHGITKNDVLNAPTFKELWPDIFPYLNNQIVVAHNSSFDISVLRRTLEMYSIPLPTLEILCTYKIAQAAFENIGSYRLNLICSKLNIELNHHNAESDAIGCSKILCTIMNSNNLSNLNDLKKFYSIRAGSLREVEIIPEHLKPRNEWGYCSPDAKPYQPCSCKSIKPTSHKIDLSKISTEYPDEDFLDKNFVFTGTLLSMPRNKAQEIVAKGGGIPQSNINKSTDYLVLGLQDFRQLAAGATISSKMKKAYDMQSSGHKIQIISEEEFVNMIDDELYSICFS